MFISDNLLVFEHKKYNHLDSYLNRKKVMSMVSWNYVFPVLLENLCVLFNLGIRSFFLRVCVCVSIFI